MTPAALIACRSMGASSQGFAASRLVRGRVGEDLVERADGFAGRFRQRARRGRPPRTGRAWSGTRPRCRTARRRGGRPPKARRAPGARPGRRTTHADHPETTALESKSASLGMGGSLKQFMPCILPRWTGLRSRVRSQHERPLRGSEKGGEQMRTCSVATAEPEGDFKVKRTDEEWRRMLGRNDTGCCAINTALERVERRPSNRSAPHLRLRRLRQPLFDSDTKFERVRDGRVLRRRRKAATRRRRIAAFSRDALRCICRRCGVIRHVFRTAMSDRVGYCMTVSDELRGEGIRGRIKPALLNLSPCTRFADPVHPSRVPGSVRRKLVRGTRRTNSAAGPPSRGSSDPL